MGWLRTDDLNNTFPATQVTFGLDGKAFVLDLDDSEHAALTRVLQRYVTVAVPYGELPEPPEFPVRSLFQQTAEAVEPVASSVAPQPRRRGEVRSTASVSTTGATNKAPEYEGAATAQRTIRFWANHEGGYNLGPKGRIPERIIAHYHEVHGTKH